MIAQQLKALADLPEDQSSDRRIHGTQFTIACNSSFKGPETIFWPFTSVLKLGADSSPTTEHLHSTLEIFPRYGEEGLFVCEYTLFLECPSKHIHFGDIYTANVKLGQMQIQVVCQYYLD